eukprot:CAMPEP_0201525214 /NCGR_PEP_ID=MMETSP0161_2-20130828/27259_1 /ASSEMBLY_ACC=CAM_ASM_000251 /TAXON_ID=180227 /ORGANISM="Neoparamoeba aestuarina, Strain SoJaBio B1-5/56/2" /LENGTH=359 /DNA_ID=CAMNT_0047925043 /DNA_START=48 /DNA_END=1124 /DNA_ORIENTATION=-
MRRSEIWRSALSTFFSLKSGLSRGVTTTYSTNLFSFPFGGRILPQISKPTPCSTDLTTDSVDFSIGKLSPIQGLSLPMSHILPSSLAEFNTLSHHNHTQGELTDSLARFLSDECGFPVDPDELVVTAGNSEAIYAVTCHLLSEDDSVAVETPTFFLADYLFREARGTNQKQMAIPLDADGMKISYLENQIARGNCPKLVYTIPNFHNPTGVCLSEERKARLVDLAQEHNFYILSDDPYHLLNYNRNEPRPSCLMAHDKGRGRVISAGSFSKILNAELRLGWIHADKKLVDGFLHKWVGDIDPTLSVSLKNMIEEGRLHRHLRHLSMTLSKRGEAMCRALNLYLPDGCDFEPIDGGYFVW